MFASKLGTHLIRTAVLEHTFSPARPFVTSAIRRQPNMAENKQPNVRRLQSFEDPSVQSFLQELHQLMVKSIVDETTHKTNVCNFEQPETLQNLIEVNFQDEPSDKSNLLNLCEKIIHYSVKTGHPRFYNQQYAGKDPYSLAGAWLTESLTTNLHTYEVAPVFVLLEKYVISKVCQLIGYKEGDGLFCPGGSFSNMLALHVARYKHNPSFKQTGLFGQPPMVLFAHTDAHYSISKGANFLGFGTDNVCRTKTNSVGCMDVTDLQNKIQEAKSKGHTPLFVMASAGTTVLGTFDDMNAVADVCEKHNIWMHVDGAWGTAVLLSPKHRHLLDGIQRADSVSWNPHKMCGIPLQCSVLMLKEKGLLEKCNAYRAEYLFQPDKPYDTSYDVGDKTVQCGRKVDVLKLWLQWKAIGNKGMAERVDHAFEMAKLFTKKLEKAEGFRLVMPEYQYTNVSFWYIPPRLRGKEENADWWNEIAMVAPQIKTRMVKQGTLMIGYQPLTSRNLVNFFRIILENPLTDESELDFVISEITRLGSDL